MILLCGIPSERPLAMVRDRLLSLAEPVAVLNQRDIDSTELSYAIGDGMVSGELSLSGRRYRLEHVRSVYMRLMNPHHLPELEGERYDSRRRAKALALHDLLVRWCEISPARVVNRLYAGSSNGSKIFQSRLLADAGFRVPETLVTNDPDEARRFVRERGAVIFKSASGARSIVMPFTDAHLLSVERIVHCPTLFQELVRGTNVRVHVIGDETFATRVDSQAVDYRYAAQTTGEPWVLTATAITEETTAACISVTRQLGMGFAGIDLIVTPDGVTYCLEVNPSPGFSYYELNTGQPIALSLARYLAAA